MKKSDLKTGMIIEIRHGAFGKVLLGTSKGDVIGGTNAEDEEAKSTWCQLDSYTDDLRWDGISSFGKGRRDVVKIYDADFNDNAASIIHKGKLLWKRNDIDWKRLPKLFGANSGITMQVINEDGEAIDIKSGGRHNLVKERWSNTKVLSYMLPEK